MSLDKLRYSLTDYMEKYFFTAENYFLLIHHSVANCYDLINKVNDNIDLMPRIDKTSDGVDIKFYRVDYNEEVYSKSELLAFIWSTIDKDWDVIKGIELRSGRIHFWCKKDDIIYDPAMGILTKDEVYTKYYKQVKVIFNGDIGNYLLEKDNLRKYYKEKTIGRFFKIKTSNFSVDLVLDIKRRFNKNVENQYILDKEKIEHIKSFFMLDNFIELRQVLTHKRKSYLQSDNIGVHPLVDSSILEEIAKYAGAIKELMRDEYDINMDYYQGTIGNCYGLSIMFNLFNGDYKLVQGGIPYQGTKKVYQHSWLEKGGIVYDPALRVVTLADLYYMFVIKQDEYTKSETEDILRRIGFNLTHFRDFIDGRQIGSNETIRYRLLVNKIDSPEFRENGEKLISLVKAKKG